MSAAYDADLEPTEEEDAGPAPFDLMAAVGNPNLAFDLDDSTLARIGAKVVEEYKIDLASRVAAGYEEKIKKAVELASLVAEKKNTPWPGAANIKSPVLIEAAIQFNARSYPAIIDGPNLAKGAVKGRPTPEKQDRADRIGRHMSYQLLEEEEEWEDDTDELLLRVPIVGTLVRKRYFDPVKGRNCSEILAPDEFVVNYRAKRDLNVCQRSTHVLTFYPNDIEEKRRSGLWLDVELGEPHDAANDDDAPHRFLEQHRLLDLDEDGYKEPYIVTVHEETEKVVRIKARWRANGVKSGDDGRVIRIQPYKCFTKYGFIPNPDGSFYDVGYGTLLGSTTETINTILNQLIDAGTLANTQGGWIGGGVSIKSGRQGFTPGEYKKVDGGIGSLRDNILPLDFKEPSTVLFSLLSFLIEGAKGLTATQDILTGDAGKGTMPVGTVQALVEQGLKTFTAIVKRTHRSLKRELGIQYELNAEYLEEEVYVTFQDQPIEVLRSDYTQGDMDVVPTSDPTMATDLQRMSQAQFKMEVAGNAGGNVRAAGKGALRAARVSAEEIEEIFPDEPPPPDPKVIEAENKAEMEDRRTEMEAHKTAADVEKTQAETAKLKAELAMMGPDFLAAMDQIVQQAVEQTMARMNGGSPQVRPDDGQGMGAGPPDAPPEAVLPGPAGEAGPPMGFGGGDGPPPADQGPPDGGIGDPGLEGLG